LRIADPQYDGCRVYIAPPVLHLVRVKRSNPTNPPLGV
jgi:hypothetical protein